MSREYGTDTMDLGARRVAIGVKVLMTIVWANWGTSVCLHLCPQGLDVAVWRKYEDFVAELSARFPHEAEGIKAFYDTCWKVCERRGGRGGETPLIGGI